MWIRHYPKERRWLSCVPGFWNYLVRDLTLKVMNFSHALVYRSRHTIQLAACETCEFRFFLRVQREIKNVYPPLTNLLPTLQSLVYRPKVMDVLWVLWFQNRFSVAMRGIRGCQDPMYWINIPAERVQVAQKLYFARDYAGTKSNVKCHMKLTSLFCS